MRENKPRSLWSESRGGLNCWMNVDSTLAAEAMLGCDWDSITIDLRHSLVDRQSVLTRPMIESRRKPPASAPRNKEGPPDGTALPLSDLGFWRPSAHWAMADASPGRDTSRQANLLRTAATIQFRATEGRN